MITTTEVATTSTAPLNAHEAPRLQVSDLGVAFTDAAGAKSHVVGNLDLTAAPGQLVCLTGRSGSGKTSVLRCLLGLATPTAGEVIWDNITMASMTPTQAADFRRQRTAYLDQSSTLLPELTVLENILLPLLPDGRAAVRAHIPRARHFIAGLGLQERVRATPDQLSGGERQRVGLARVLAAGTPGLVTDEPTASLDRRWADQVAQLLREYADNGALVIVASHDPAFPHLADITLTLDKTRTISSGSQAAR